MLNKTQLLRFFHRCSQGPDIIEVHEAEQVGTVMNGVQSTGSIRNVSHYSVPGDCWLVDPWARLPGLLVFQRKWETFFPVKSADF